MQALELCNLGDLQLTDRPCPTLSDDDVLIKTAVTTICTSDLNDIYRNPFHAPFPRILGHEAAGVVTEIGHSVKNVSIGQNVAVHPVIPCQKCQTCRRGLGHLCSKMGHLGLNWDGTFAEFFRIRSDRVRPVGSEVDATVAALLEPVAVCMQSINRGRVVSGERVLILGDGPFGILTSRLATRLGAEVTIVGQHPFRLQRAHAKTAICEKDDREIQTNLLKLCGSAFDVAILCVASSSATNTAIACLRERGRLVVFSAFDGPVQVDLFRVHVNELEIVGACNDEDCIDTAASLLNQPELRLQELITHTLPLQEFRRGFDLVANGKEEALKVAFDLRETR